MCTYHIHVYNDATVVHRNDT